MFFISFTVLLLWLPFVFSTRVRRPGHLLSVVLAAGCRGGLVFVEGTNFAVPCVLFYMEIEVGGLEVINLCHA